MGRKATHNQSWSYGHFGYGNFYGSAYGCHTYSPYDFANYEGWGWSNEPQHYEPGWAKKAKGRSSWARTQATKPPSMDIVTEFIMSLPEVRGKSRPEVAALLTRAASKIDAYED